METVKRYSPTLGLLPTRSYVNACRNPRIRKLAMNVVNKTCEASPQPLLRGRGLSEGHSILTTQEFESDQYFDYERYELRFQPAEGVVVVEKKKGQEARVISTPLIWTATVTVGQDECQIRRTSSNDDDEGIRQRWKDIVHILSSKSAHRRSGKRMVCWHQTWRHLTFNHI